VVRPDPQGQLIQPSPDPQLEVTGEGLIVKKKDGEKGGRGKWKEGKGKRTRGGGSYFAYSTTVSLSYPAAVSPRLRCHSKQLRLYGRLSLRLRQLHRPARNGKTVNFWGPIFKTS